MLNLLQEVKRNIKALLLFALMYKDEEYLKKAEEEIKRDWGDIIFEKYIGIKDYYKYYEKEMGEGLHKKFVAIDNLIEKDKLIELKKYSMKLEDKYRINSNRTVNIDPIYLDMFQVVVASSKDKGSRIYLGEGVFAEIELLYHHGSFHPLLWTYLDYKENIDFFNEVRKIYLSKRS
ncbi:protein of unknown function [Venenivibrio stagnispumantis]|uniref:GTP-binding protein n=1 Tax=Venenivibrio stagnispumantis TaxID=407998 RepID=A0AA45WN11_9AQUI|nr:DUF4416 family protein [Venenivibrio stagnispumantis]SMP16011.1 protein of unknown function [Venenivibrio stagnispumantis]